MVLVVIVEVAKVWIVSLPGLSRSRMACHCFIIEELCWVQLSCLKFGELWCVQVAFLLSVWRAVVGATILPQISRAVVGASSIP
jgi:hypothetical protein